MKGKIVNTLLGLLNIMIGVMILVYTMVIPTDITTLTVQENEVTNFLQIAIYVLIVITSIFNFIGIFNNKASDEVKLGYKLFLFTIGFYFIKQPFFAIIPAFSGILVIKGILKENLREIENTLTISIISLVILATLVIDGSTYLYSNIGNYILDKKNENQKAYNSNFFRYVTELEDNYSAPFINVKRNGKYGYVDTNGNVVIDFQYDFASPFTTITAFGRQHQIALVCEDGISKIIMKNKREVATYVSESPDLNYEEKIEELENFCIKNFEDNDNVEFEIVGKNNNINKVISYKDESESYTYRYNYNDEYDVTVTKSSMGLNDSYALIRKDDSGYKIELDCEHLDYDENYLYLFQDGTIPFYNNERNEQGWFSGRGIKKSLKGKVQILEKLGDGQIFLYKDYSNNGKIFFGNQEGKTLSPAYKEIYIVGENRYIVKNEDEKYNVIDSNYSKVFEGDYDYVDTSLLEYGIYLFGNLNDAIEFNDYNYAKLNFTMINAEGNMIIDNLEQVYTKYYKLDNSEDGKIGISKNSQDDFSRNLKSLDVKFVGDKYYSK